MEKDEKIKLGISIGDLNGIGGELVIKTFEDSRMLEFCTPIIYASVKTLSFFKKHFESSLDFNSIQSAEQAVDSKVNVVTVWRDDVRINFGEEDLKIGSYAIKSLRDNPESAQEEYDLIEKYDDQGLIAKDSFQYSAALPSFNVNSQFTDRVKFESKDTLRTHFKMNGT